MSITHTFIVFGTFESVHVHVHVRAAVLTDKGIAIVSTTALS